MKLLTLPQIRTLAFSKPPVSELGELDVKYDPQCIERAVKLITECRRLNIQPATLVCGPQAFVSIWIDLNRRDLHEVDKDRYRLLASGFLEFTLYGIRVELEITTSEQDSLRLTTAEMSGLSIALTNCK